MRPNVSECQNGGTPITNVPCLCCWSSIWAFSTACGTPTTSKRAGCPSSGRMPISGWCVASAANFTISTKQNHTATVEKCMAKQKQLKNGQQWPASTPRFLVSKFCTSRTRWTLLLPTSSGPRSWDDTSQYVQQQQLCTPFSDTSLKQKYTCKINWDLFNLLPNSRGTGMSVHSTVIESETPCEPITWPRNTLLL